ncbi:MAG: hypothetical protein AAF412_04900, partial [Pseudomonadota bacterium]
MRILKVTLVVFAAALVTSLSGIAQQTDDQPVQNTALVPNKIDQIVTGHTISSDAMVKWEESRKRYLECPQCVA